MTRSSPNPRGRLPVALAVSTLLLVLGACGGGQDAPGSVDAGSAAAVADEPGALPVPTLPSVASRLPDQFDDTGCVLGPDGSDCQSGAAAIDAAQAGTDGDWRHLRGFSGVRWTTQATDRLVLLDDTVTTAAAGPWSATGLVRNEQAVAVSAPTVTATLLDAAGAELAVVQAPALLPVLRPGEPGPFVVEAEVDASQVATVRWSTAGEHGPDDHRGRDLELSVLWQRFPDDPRPADLYLHRDPPNGPHPLVVFGQALAVGPDPIRGTRVVGAWISAEGRVVAVTEATVARPEGLDLDAMAAADPGTLEWTPPDLVAGESADLVLVVSPDEVPADLVDARLVLWGTGS